jgi:phage recombination protein Bet
MALLVVSDQYKLNPFTKEIYAFRDRKRGGIVPVVSVDGWSRIINEHPALDGIEFNYSEVTGTHKNKKNHEWIECVISRKDRAKPTVIREFFAEVVRTASFETPWDTHPNRMHRHKALIQCARIAFGFAGIYDQDEAERIIDVEPINVTSSRIDEVRGDLSGVENEFVTEHVAAIKKLLDQFDKEEKDIAQDCRDYVEVHLQKFNELYMCVCDKLARDKIISKAKWRKLLEVGPIVLDRGETHTA